MAHLSISCLGPFEVTLGGQPVTGFKSNKVRALLAYLAAESARAFRREVLAGLLWPNFPDRNAHSNLRYALSNLRRVIGDSKATTPYLLIQRESLQFNQRSDYFLDASLFLSQITPKGGHNFESQKLSSLEEAVELYRGDFLEGFAVNDCVDFEDWMLLKRQQIARQFLSALGFLATTYEQRGEYEKAQFYARRQVDREPWDEKAHRQLMRTLALSGRRGAALTQYEACRRLLEEELGVEPSEATANLYKQIRSDALKKGKPGAPAVVSTSARLPRFLEEVKPGADSPLFVSRERELAELEVYLDRSLDRGGRVAFVTGDAGSGKTTLIQEFCRLARQRHSDLVVCGGNCNAHTGIGDPYLPFREILEMLTGNVEARWAAGDLSSEQAAGIWQLLPVTARILIDCGPDLVGTFLPGSALLERAQVFEEKTDGWLESLRAIADREAVVGQGKYSPGQKDLFEQYTRVLQRLAQQKPLLLVVDDLQWADLGSVSLLFHLSRQIAASRILIVGAYRPEEVAIGRDGQRHPLDPVVNQVKRDYGEVIIRLSQAEKREFVEALLDSEPNRLSKPFREMLYRQTRGHPLFTIELLRGLQDRGDLVKDSKGRWVDGPDLNWETIPARVEAVIAERIGRLSRPLQSILQVASVEGEVFTAEAIAQVRGISVREAVGYLSQELDRSHRLVRTQAIEKIGSSRVSRYRFRNYLFQKYLYEQLDEVERVYLHEDVGNRLEQLYSESASSRAAIAPQLARHFQEAGVTEKAVHYLGQAGQRAARLSAYREAITHLTSGIDLLMTLPDSPERALQELGLQLTLSIAWTGAKHVRAEELQNTYKRTYDLCQQLGKTPELCQVLEQMVVFHYVAAEYRAALEFAEESLALAQSIGDQTLIAINHWYLGVILFCLGDMPAARKHLEHVISCYEPQRDHESFVLLRGKDIGLGAMAYYTCCLWCLGYPDQADKTSQDALAWARSFGHTFSLTEVLHYGVCLYHAMIGEADPLIEGAEEMAGLIQKVVPAWRGSGTCFLGEGLAIQGKYQEGIEQILAGLSERQSIEARCSDSNHLGALAKAQFKAGRTEEARATLARTFAFVEETGERYWVAELLRLQGEILRMEGDEAGARASLQQAIDIAQGQREKSLELRATIDLATLWQKQGRKDEAVQALKEIYGWFTEGFETPDLKRARSMIEALED